MSADELRQAVGELREFWPEAPIESRLAAPLADWLENVAAWTDEGLGVLPETNLTDAWWDSRDYALTIARLINGGAA